MRLFQSSFASHSFRTRFNLRVQRFDGLVEMVHLHVALSLFASYVVALTVVPLFCARFIKASHHGTPSDERPVEVDRPRRNWL